MIIVVQRVARASVTVEGEVVGAIGRGLCLLACAVTGDAPADAHWLADKIAELRVFEDAAGKTNLALADVQGALLLVPQFTLAADWRKGRRPAFTRAASPAEARALLQALAAWLQQLGVPLAQGRFGAAMALELVNDGPLTLILDSALRGPAARRQPPGST